MFEQKGLALSESLNVFSKIQNALNVIKTKCFKKQVIQCCQKMLATASTRNL